MMPANWVTASVMADESSAASSSWRNSGIAFWGDILVSEAGLADLLLCKSASTLRPESGLASLRFLFRLWTLGGTGRG